MTVATKRPTIDRFIWTRSDITQLQESTKGDGEGPAAKLVEEKSEDEIANEVWGIK